MTQMTIPEILAEFTPINEAYKHTAVDAAVEQREAIIPYLLQILEETVANPKTRDDSVSHIYALMLLGHFRATEAHTVITNLFGLPDDIPEDLFGDMVTEDLPIVLLQTCGGSVEHILALIQKRDANAYCRGSAAVALSYAVAEGFVTREAALAFLSGLFTGEEDADQTSSFWDQIATTINDLYPDEAMPAIQRAYELELITQGWIGLNEFEETLTTSTPQAALDEIRHQIKMHSLDNIHERMSGWAMFREQKSTPIPQSLNTQTSSQPSTLSQGSKSILTKKQKAKRKQKQKMAQVSRKKNRRK